VPAPAFIRQRFLFSEVAHVTEGSAAGGDATQSWLLSKAVSLCVVAQVLETSHIAIKVPLVNTKEVTLYSMPILCQSPASAGVRTSPQHLTSLGKRDIHAENTAPFECLFCHLSSGSWV
jgi:hypothetical protein